MPCLPMLSKTRSSAYVHATMLNLKMMSRYVHAVAQAIVSPVRTRPIILPWHFFSLFCSEENGSMSYGWLFCGPHLSLFHRSMSAYIIRSILYVVPFWER